MLVAVLLSGALFSGLIFVVLGPILPMIASHFDTGGHGVRFAQWTMTAPAIGLVAGGLVGGGLFDRFGPKAMLPIAFAVYGIAGAGGGFVENGWLLLGSRLVAGFCAVVISVGATAVIAEVFDDATRARMLGYKNAIASGAGIVGVLISGQLAATFGWRTAFLIYGIALLFVVPAALGLRHHVPSPRVPRAERGRWRALGASWFIYAAVVLFGIVVMAPLTQMPFLLREIGIEGARKLSLILGASSVGTTLGAVVYGSLFARLGAKRVFVFDMALWAAGLVVLGTTASELHAGLGCLIAGTASGIFVVHLLNVLVGRVAPAHRGRAAGLFFVALFAGDFLTPLALLPMAEAFGRHMTFLLLVIPCMIACGGVAAARPRPAVRIA